jgi:uncharacterized protein (TIGR02453 family)
LRVTFKGWPAEAIEFFDGLEFDNSKAYFDEHKDTYLGCVKAPMEALLAELAPEFGPPKIFRPNRDVRFSKDKSPYKTNIAATLGARGYVTLSAAGLGVGGGMWRMMPDQLERYRAAVDDERTGAEIVGIAEALRAAGHECGPHDALKTAPKGYPKDHPRIDLLRAKGLTAWHQWPVGAWLHKPKAKDRIVDFLHAAEPLHTWLTTRVGESSIEA